MNDSLAGLRIGVLQSRDAHHLSKQLTKRGAHVISAPILRESPADCSEEINDFVEGLDNREFDVTVMQTGVGVTTLFNHATRLARRVTLRQGLADTICIARGPKPAAALRKVGVTNYRQVAAPYTTYELISTFCDIELAYAKVAVIHYGEINVQLASFLNATSDEVFDLCVYRWELPENLEPATNLIHEILDSQIDVLAFTSQIQVRHLMTVADQLGVKDELLSSMERPTIAAVGPTCASVLKNLGIRPDIVPEYPKMGHMLRDLSKRFMLAPA